MNDNQRRFVSEYLLDLNAAQAAIRAGYSAKTASSQGERLLRNAEVQAAIAVGIKERAERTQLSADDVLQELAVLGRSSIWDYSIDDQGNVTLAQDVPQRAIRAVSSIKKKTRHYANGDLEHTTEIRLWDKNAALGNLGKHLGLLKDRVEHTGLDGGPFQVEVLTDVQRATAITALLARVGQRNPGPPAPGPGDEPGPAMGGAGVPDDGGGDAGGPLADDVAPL